MLCAASNAERSGHMPAREARAYARKARAGSPRSWCALAPQY